LSFRKRLTLPIVIVFLVVVALNKPCSAQGTLQIHDTLNSAQSVRLEHTTHPLAQTVSDAGPVEDGKTLERMLLALAPEAAREAELKKFLDEQQNPSSPNYRHWLTAQEFGTRFGVTDADVLAVRDWLGQMGFTVGAVAKSKRWVEFSGSAQQVENAFQTHLRYYNVGGKKYLANASDLSIPIAVAQVSRGVASLNSFRKQPPQKLFAGIAGRNTQGQKVRLQPSLTATGSGSNVYYLAPGDFATIYNTKPLLAAGIDGTGVTIVVVGQSQIELTDVRAFRQIFQLKDNDPNIIVSGPDPGITAPTDLQEAMLDVEWAGAIAPGATIDLVIAGSTDTTNGVDLAAAYAIDNQLGSILTYTYGSCEQALGSSGNAFYNALWQQAAAEGITILVAAGDNGSAGCDASSAGQPATQGLAVNGAASTPYNIAVGGTQFAENGNEAAYWSSSNAADYSSALGYIPEAVWNESCDTSQSTSGTNCYFQNSSFEMLAGAGGASSVYAKPTWQAGTGVPADGMRDVPDVAIAAASGHDDIVYCLKSAQIACQVTGNEVVGLTLVGGTSAATPSMAGILALVEQKNGAFQGQANYTLYKLAQSGSCDSSLQTNPAATNSCVFYDVTLGNNQVPCVGGPAGCSSARQGTKGFMSGYAASTGYDLATGLGSVNTANLANAWSSVTFAGSQTMLQLATTSFTHGTAVALNGAVSVVSGTGIPTGSVSLRTDQFGATDVLPITNGVFTGSVKDLPGGQYQLSAHYAGDGMFGPSDSAAVALNVAPEASTTIISLIPASGSVNYGDTLSVNVKVAGASGVGIATGSVTLSDGATTIGTYSLGADGSAFISTGQGSSYTFPTGTHSLTATYTGDNSFNPSTASATPLNIGKGMPTVVVGLNTSDVNEGVPVAARVTVAGFGSATATGQVQFTVDGVAFGAILPLQIGGFFGTQAQASILIMGLAAGTHTIGASYDGSSDPNFVSVPSAASYSQAVTVEANQGTSTTTTITNSTTPSTIGANGTFTVAVNPPAATGTVSLWDAVGPRSSPAPIQSGGTSIQIVWPQAGSASLYAVYSGDTIYAGSSSRPVTFSVAKGTPQVVLTAPASSDPTQQVSLVARVTGSPTNSALAFPTGAVEFWDSINGGASQLVKVQSLTAGAGNIGMYGLRTKLARGTHILKAHYRGDSNWLAADSASISLSLTGDFTLDVSPDPVVFAAGSPGSTTMTVTPTGGFTGLVTFVCPTGTNNVPVSYTCTLNPNPLSVTSGVATATLTLAPGAATGVLHTAGIVAPSQSLWKVELAVGLLLLGFMVAGADGSNGGRGALFAGGCLLCVSSIVTGCGGGGGGGGGPVLSTTTLTTTNNRATFQTPITFTATVSAPVNPGGTVQLYDNEQTYGNAGTLTAGVATFLTTNLPIGVHTISAKYSGDSNTLPSSSSAINQMVLGTIQLQVTATANGGIAHPADFIVVLN
jgi:Pro-kumamolisin, activation domain/Bacterial Ig-like domain (group 3)